MCLISHFALANTETHISVCLLSECVFVCVCVRQLQMNGEGPECQRAADRSGHTKYMSPDDVAQGLGNTHMLQKAGGINHNY